MKKFLIVMFLIIINLSSVCYANNDPWFDIGRSIGSSIGNGPTGNDEKNFYYDENFDFSKIKFLIVASNVPQGFERYVSDPYISKKYPAVIIKAFDNKFKVMTIGTYLDYYGENIAPLHPNYTNEEHLNNLFAMIKNSGGAFLNSSILAYNQNPYDSSIGNCLITFSLKTIDNNEIMYYSDQRLNAPRSSKEGMSKRIAKKFVDNFMDIIDKSNN